MYRATSQPDINQWNAGAIHRSTKISYSPMRCAAAGGGGNL